MKVFIVGIAGGVGRRLADQLVAARPTAVNLSWAVESIMKDLGKQTFNSTSEIGSFILQKAKTIHTDDMERCHTMAEHGLSVIPKEARVLRIATPAISQQLV